MTGWKNEIRQTICGSLQVCSDVNDTRLVCVLPALLLPAKIKLYLDSLLPEYNQSQSHQDFIPGAVSSLMSRGYVDDGAGNKMSVYVGLLFDGNVKYRNLSSQLGHSGSIVLVPGPAILAEPPRIIDLAVAQEADGYSIFWVSIPWIVFRDRGTTIKTRSHSLEQMLCPRSYNCSCHGNWRTRWMDSDNYLFLL